MFSALFQGHYSKITFRSPLYVGGSPSTYWLVRATGTNRGFVGCIQSLTVNNKATDLRPWPLGRALSGADIGEEAVCVIACVISVIFLWLLLDYYLPHNGSALKFCHSDKEFSSRFRVLPL